MHRALFLLIASVLPAGILSSCGKAPVPVENVQQQAASPHPGGVPHPGGAPRAGGTPHPSLGQPGASSDAHFAGVVRLRGELADREQGFVFVSIKPQGINMPCFSRKYSLADPQVSAKENGERVLSFELDESHTMGGMVPGALNLEAWFDEDGFVDTKDDGVINLVPTAANDSSIEIILEL